MHISNLVYQLTSKMPWVVERPWPLASRYAPDAESALCHMLLLVIKDKTRLCGCHTPLWRPPLFSYQRKGKMSSQCRTQPPILSSIISKHSADLRNMERENAVEVSPRGWGWRKERRGPFAAAEQEKEHTPAQYKLVAETSNNGNNQLFLILLTFKKNIFF